MKSSKQQQFDIVLQAGHAARDAIASSRRIIFSHCPGIDTAIGFLRQPWSVVVLVGLFFLVIAHPAHAHHPFGGQLPSNFLMGFLSGLGHPVIGIDHLFFVVAIGLLASRVGSRQGSRQVQYSLAIPVAFVLATMVGTGIHLMALDLPLPEIVISASVLAFGFMLAMKENPKWGAIAFVAAIAGIFHGYAYGEAVVGAEMTPLIAYLAGFSIIQFAIALFSYRIGRLNLKQLTEQASLKLRFVGFTICGAGIAFLAGTILG